ncbi:MAG: hypothetical protein GXO68_04255 [Crenarchaeota archaeon]|nr:hypothetical protein [Thermoproteota archaeon]
MALRTWSAGAILFLLLVIAIQSTPTFSEAQTLQSTSQLPALPIVNETKILTIPLPGIPSPDASVRIIVGGPPGYTIAVDENFNGKIDSGEKSVQASLQGDLAYSIVIPLNASTSATLLQLVSQSGRINALITIKYGQHYAAYSAPIPGQVLISPPVTGKLVIAPYNGKVVNVAVAGEHYIVKPGEVLELCKPSNVTVVAANGSIVGVLYSFDQESWWATELMPLNMTSNPIVGFSTMHASVLGVNGTVYGIIVGGSGNYSVYKLDKLATTRPVKGKGVVFYAVYSANRLVGIAPDYPGVASRYKSGGAVVLGGKGFLDDNYLIISTRGSQSLVALLDTDGDGKYEVYSPGDGVGANYYYSDNANQIMILSDNNAPLVIEGVDDPALYEVIFPKGGIVTATNLYTTYSGEGWTLSLGESNDSINVTLTVIPRSEYGGITAGAIAIFTPDFKPIQGSGKKLKPTNDTLGSLVASTVINKTYAANGFYVAYMIVYQNGVGISTMLRSSPPLYNYRESEIPTQPAACNGIKIGFQRVATTIAAGQGYPIPTSTELDLNDYADLFYQASITTRTTTSPTTTLSISEVLVNQTVTSSEKPSPPLYLVAAIIAIVVFGIYASYNILRKER